MNGVWVKFDVKNKYVIYRVYFRIVWDVINDVIHII